MLRSAIAAGTPVGRQAAPFMELGDMVPDEVLIDLIGERISHRDCARGYVLDGFPRTLRQAAGLEGMEGGAPEGFFVFNVDVPRTELLRRLSGRRWCPKCQATYHVDSKPPKREGICDVCSTHLVQREDDKETVVSHRLGEHDARNQALVEHYRGRARYHEVDGNRPADVVFDELARILEARR
jgi:adenylate kinase